MGERADSRGLPSALQGCQTPFPFESPELVNFIHLFLFGNLNLLSVVEMNRNLTHLDFMNVTVLHHQGLLGLLIPWLILQRLEPLHVNPSLNFIT